MFDLQVEIYFADLLTVFCSALGIFVFTKILSALVDLVKKIWVRVALYIIAAILVCIFLDKIVDVFWKMNTWFYKLVGKGGVSDITGRLQDLIESIKKEQIQ